MAAALTDETGRRYGRLAVLERAPTRGSRHARWIARCDCGRAVEVFGINLRTGKTQSCGSCQPGRGGRAPAIDETGRRYGRLTVLGRAPRGAARARFARWRCRCACGRETVVSGSALRRGNTRSCGQCRPKGRQGQLAPAEVVELRKRRVNGASVAQLAADYGVSDSLITAITVGLAYAAAGGPIFEPRRRRKRC